MPFGCSSSSWGFARSDTGPGEEPGASADHVRAGQPLPSSRPRFRRNEMHAVRAISMRAILPATTPPTNQLRIPRSTDNFHVSLTKPSSFRPVQRFPSAPSPCPAGPASQSVAAQSADELRPAKSRRSSTHQPALDVRLGQHIAQCRPQRAREDKGGPEQNRVRDSGGEVGRRDHRDQSAKYQRAALETETSGIRQDSRQARCRAC